ncbi:MAG: hypothetical protein HMLKMBBP_00410 [Planctomycetes bacterium]|nr:hypothetical protein [Planctomycetota bacterium]
MTDWNARSRAPILQSLAAAVLGAALLGAPRLGEAAWDGRQAVRLGDQMRAEFRADPLAEEHVYSFFAVEGTVFSARMAVLPGADGLVTEIRLFTSNDVEVPLGAALSGNRVRGFVFGETGDYYLRVRSTSGTGEYNLSTKARFPRVVAGSSDDGSFGFDSLSDVLMSARVRAPRGSDAAPVFTGLDFQGGAVDLGAQNGTAKLVGILLPEDAAYTLSFTSGAPSADRGEGPGFGVRVTLRNVRPARSWSFGHTEATSGTATENRAKWLTSAHADHTAAAFNNWNTTDPPAVPTTCAKCHSTPGYRDFLGADGSAAGVVNSPAPIGTVVDCDACHNDAAAALTSVTFPSGKTVSGLGKEARCMVCHQGRESSVSVESKIANAAIDAMGQPIPGFGPDTVSSKINFTNIHYFAAAASLYGRDVDGGYEYADPTVSSQTPDPVTGLTPRQPYDRKFAHVSSMDSCIECHDPHSQQVRIDLCATCHVDAQGNPVADIDGLHDIRMQATLADFDGDGTREGTWHELKGLQDKLLAAIQIYADQVLGQKITYDPHSYPYFFKDTDGNGVANGGEITRTNGYSTWTGRLLRACYNYQFAEKDPGGFAHNGKYLIQLLYDSIADINSAAAVPDFANLVRNDTGHFDSSAHAYRNWDYDADNLVNETCARCHTPDGFLFRVTYNVDPTIPQDLSSGMVCESCHEEGADFGPNASVRAARRYVGKAAFPYPTTATSTQINAVTVTNGAKGTVAEDDSLLCLTCHVGRASKLTIDAYLATNPTTISFQNVHYLPAGAVQYGNRAAVGYQYAGKTYAGRWDHANGLATSTTTPAAVPARCSYCHLQEGDHSFEVHVGTECQGCHFEATAGASSFRKGRTADYDGDGNALEPLKDEVSAFAARLYTTIQNYAFTVRGTRIAYYSESHPYWFRDTNGNGSVDVPAENTSSNPYKAYDAKLLYATHNYQLYKKEPGAWAHNTHYVLQILYDSIQDLGGDVTGLTRP